ncbi:chemotaxis protein CheW [Luteimonas sp. XNQY3]|nr:chemotaxis protein CheW [Luteimonas sp. XNQY3]MCD9008027.1 chemotaxis protein CheW [Luteimonas sp. XNQY3]
MTPAGVVDDYLGMLLSTAPGPAPAPAHAARAATPAPPVAAEAPAVASPAPVHAAAVPPAAAAPVAPSPAPVAGVAAPPPKPAAAPPRATPAAARVAFAAPPRSAVAASGLAATLPPQQRRAADRMARWLRLRCGAQAYAIELLKIREVVLPAPLLALRGAAPCLAGVMNLRGQVVPVVDLGLQLGDAPVEETASTRIIVLDDAGDVLGLRVSSVEDVVLIGDAQIEGTHTSRLAPVGDHRIRGIARLGGAMMLLLDANRLMAIPLFPPR